MNRRVRVLGTACIMSLVVLGCKDTDALVLIDNLTVSLPATATAEDGWALVQVSITQDQTTQTILLSESTTTITVPIAGSTQVSVSTISSQVNNGSSVGWYTSTQSLDPMGGENQLEIQASPSPAQTANFQPHLYHAEAQENVPWSRELAILFVDLNTGFTTSPVFKTNQELTMPVGVDWVAVFVEESNYGTQIDTFGSNIAEIIEYHNSLASSPEGLVFFDHDEGLVLNSTGGVSMGIQGLVGYDAVDHNGLVPLVVGQAPTMSTTAESNPSSSTDTVEEGSVVLTELAGFPETDTAFSIECAADQSCTAATGWQACTQPFEVTEAMMFKVRYDEIPTLGCLSFEIRMDTDADLGGDDSCSDGRSCSDALACDCTTECASSACGSPGCGSCGTCSDGQYCGGDAGSFSCQTSCTAMNQEIPVTTKNICINGRQIFACYEGTEIQRQCMQPDGLGSGDYLCGYSTDGFALCVDTREQCSPTCSQLKLGETDGCGQVCGTYHNGDSLPCGDGAALSCDPDLPAISCLDGFWNFTY